MVTKGPSIGGTHTAYAAEWRPNADSSWRAIPADEGTTGVPRSGLLPGVSGSIGLLGHKTAMALAWWFAAATERDFLTQVRVVEYTVSFNIAATRTEAEPEQIMGDFLDDDAKEKAQERML